MRKFKKTLLAATLCLALVVSCIASAFASTNVNGFPCGVCGTGTVTITTTRREVTRTMTCRHGYPDGYDEEVGDMVTEVSQCDLCTYYDATAYFEPHTTTCYGHY